MARQRRGGGFRPPELRGTLGTLLRTAAAQVGPLKDAMTGALERTAREGRARFDDIRGSRRRTDALAELGEIVLDLIRRGEIDPAEIPEVQDIVAHLDELDSGADATTPEYGHPHELDHDEPPTHVPPRNRFDARRRDPSSSGGSDDGTTSSRAWTPPRPAKPAARVWRPPVDDGEPDEAPTHHRPAHAASAPTARPSQATTPTRMVPRPKDPLRKGGIDFDDDSDLADYMHPDDVPAKKPTDDES